MKDDCTMSLYREEDIKYETGNFWVLDVGAKGFEVYQKGATHSTRVASIGPGPNMGLPRAMVEADRRQALLERSELRQSIQLVLKPHGWAAVKDDGGPPTLVATKTYDTAVGPREAEAWLGDKLRAGNLCVYAKYGDALESLWLPAAALRFQENVQAFVALADTLVAETFAAGLARARSASTVPVLAGSDRSAAWQIVFGEQATVMDPADSRDVTGPRSRESVQC